MATGEHHKTGSPACAEDDGKEAAEYDLVLVPPASSSSLPRRRESRIRVQQQRQITAAAPEPAHLRGRSCRGNSLGGYPLQKNLPDNTAPAPCGWRLAPPKKEFAPGIGPALWQRATNSGQRPAPDWPGARRC